MAAIHAKFCLWALLWHTSLQLYSRRFWGTTQNIVHREHQKFRSHSFTCFYWSLQVAEREKLSAANFQKLHLMALDAFRRDGKPSPNGSRPADMNCSNWKNLWQLWRLWPGRAGKGIIIIFFWLCWFDSRVVYLGLDSIGCFSIAYRKFIWVDFIPPDSLGYFFLNIYIFGLLTPPPFLFSPKPLKRADFMDKAVPPLPPPGNTC